jgi:hypothetical protein
MAGDAVGYPGRGEGGAGIADLAGNREMDPYRGGTETRKTAKDWKSEAELTTDLHG